MRGKTKRSESRHETVRFSFRVESLSKPLPGKAKILLDLNKGEYNLQTWQKKLVKQ